MTIEKSKSEFNFGFGPLEALGDTALSLRVRDKTELEGYGINDIFNSKLTAKLVDLRAYPTDEELLGAEVHLREVKDDFAKDTRIQIREIMSRVVNVYPVNSGNWMLFGSKGMDEISDKDLSRVAARVARVSTTFLADLTPKGVTALMISHLDDTAVLLHNAVDDHHDAELARSCAATVRVEMANEMYEMIVEMFGYGKNYWSTRDYSKYKGYVIYNTPSGQPELSGDTGTASGTMKDKLTSQICAGGMVSLEFIDNPVMVDPTTGKWQCGNVPIECNTMFGIAPGHKLNKITIKIIKNVDNNFDILMEPGA